jgi:hypothetical protein
LNLVDSQGAGIWFTGLTGAYSRAVIRSVEIGTDNYPDLRITRDAGGGSHYDIMTWKGNGNVGIGTTAPEQKLDVNGYISATGCNCDSDLRWKEKIEPIEDPIDLVTQLRGVTYEWIDKSKGVGRQLGVIAQEVEEVFPEVVHTDSQGYKTVDYSKLTAPLIEAVKSLKSENEDLKERNANLEKRLAAIEATLMKNK